MNTLSSGENWRAMLLSWRLQHFEMTSSYHCLNTLGEDQSNQLSQFQLTIERTFNTLYSKLQIRWYLKEKQIVLPNPYAKGQLLTAMIDLLKSVKAVPRANCFKHL